MRYTPGQSGNPNGRPVGVGQAADLKQMLLSKMPEIVNAVIGRALQGDMTAAKLIFDRTIPQLRPVDPRISLPQTDSNDPAGQASVVISYLLNGGMAPDIAARVMQSLTAYHQMVVLTDMEKRIAALESGNSNNSSITGPTE